MGRSWRLRKRTWLALQVVVVLALAFAIAGVAAGSTVTSSGGNAFSGTYVNDTGSAIDEIGVSTGTNGADPITSLTFDGWNCQRDTDYQVTGQYFCGDAKGQVGGTGAPLAAGASAAFSGTTKDQVKPGEIFTLCTYNGATTCTHIKIAGPKTETVSFATSTRAHMTGFKGQFRLLTTKGVGKVVVSHVPTFGVVRATSVVGQLKFSDLLFSPRDVLILDEDSVSLRVTGAKIASSQYRRALGLDVTVSKTWDEKICPLRATGVVKLIEGLDSDVPDEVTISIPGCHREERLGYADGPIKYDFVNGRKSDVAVAINQR